MDIVAPALVVVQQVLNLANIAMEEAVAETERGAGLVLVNGAEIPAANDVLDGALSDELPPFAKRKLIDAGEHETVRTRIVVRVPSPIGVELVHPPALAGV